MSEISNEKLNPYAGLRVWTNERRCSPGLERLGLTGVEVVDESGLQLFDQNTVARSVAYGFAEKLQPFKHIKSICSGAPAVLYRTREAELALTPEELERHVLSALTPQEFEAIVRTIGATWELHDDFYDPETGEALQPKGKYYVDPDESVPTP